MSEDGTSPVPPVRVVERSGSGNGATAGRPAALHPSSAPLTKSLSVVSDSTIIEQAERRIAGLEAELDRLKEVATSDLQSAHNDLMGKNREIARLKKELVDFRDEQPEAGEVRDLLILWKARLNKNGRTDIGSGGKRWKIAQSALKRWGQARCEQAIIGLSMMPWAGPGGRAAQEYPGAKRYDDVEHALGDEVRMERLVAVAKMYEKPTLLDPPIGPEPVPAVASVPAGPRLPVVGMDGQFAPDDGTKEPESETRQFVRWVYKEDCELPYVPASKEPRRRPARNFDDLPPIDKVLGALRARDCDVIVHSGRADQWSAQCPAHEDRSPSLSVHRKHNGQVLVTCWGPCETGDVIHALDLDWGDLWENSENDFNRADGPPAKKLIPAHLRHAMAQLLEAEAA